MLILSTALVKYNIGLTLFWYKHNTLFSHSLFIQQARQMNLHYLRSKGKLMQILLFLLHEGQRALSYL